MSNTDAITSVPKLKVLATNPYNALFVLHEEDHTMGNALRYTLAKNKNVDFVGYSVPHPSDPLVNIRVQTRNEVAATQVFHEGTESLKSIFNIISEQFVEANNEYMDDNDDDDE